MRYQIINNKEINTTYLNQMCIRNGVNSTTRVSNHSSTHPVNLPNNASVYAPAS